MSKNTRTDNINDDMPESFPGLKALVADCAPEAGDYKIYPGCNRETFGYSDRCSVCGGILNSGGSCTRCQPGDPWPLDELTAKDIFESLSYMEQRLAGYKPGDNPRCEKDFTELSQKISEAKAALNNYIKHLK